MRLPWLPAALAAVLSTAGCAARTVTPPAPEDDPGEIRRLELLGEFNIPALTTFDHLSRARFGGISGLALDPRSGELLGVSDDRETPRVFVFRLPPFTPGSAFRVDLHAYFPLPPHRDAPATLDAEGLAMTRAGRVSVVSEGLQNQEPRVPPAIVEYSRNYEFVRQLDVPVRFVPPSTGPMTHGVRNNASFESLTLTPDELRLFTATESPLTQDGPAATVAEGAVVRVLEYEAAGDTYLPRREFAYPVDPLGALPFEPGFSAAGLVELLALGGTELLAMERGFAQEAGGDRTVNRIRIFRVSLAGATDISGVESIDGRRIVTARKTLLLDFATIPGLSPELANLDNFEGMAFGPPLPDGGRTRIVVSDDNFNTRQRTSFLLFRAAS